MKRYVELIKNTADYLKGTQFEVTSEDDGFWSLNPFYAGDIEGWSFSCEQDCAKIISKEKYTGKVVKAPKEKYEQEEPSSYMDYYNNFP